MMTSKEYVDILDWQSAIAAAELELESLKLTLQTAGQAQNAIQQALINMAESYLRRGIARCFIPDKEGKHKEAVEDLSKAIVLGVTAIDEAYYYRAYAFYLDGDYEKAIAECENTNKSPQKEELLGKIYSAMGKYEKAVDKFKTALSHYSNSVYPPDLLESYREACKRMNSV
jgi:tetratricopeptide (TPR) repeat protein